MAAGILLTLQDANDTPLANQTGVRGYCFAVDGLDGQPQITWVLDTDGSGLLTIPVEPDFQVGDEVWVGIGLGSILDPPNWRAHFALHRVQEY